MVVSYLEKLQKQYMQEQFQKEKLLDDLQVCLKENKEFIKTLELTNDPNYETFTPREVNQRNKQKIQELKEEQEKLEQEIEQQKISLEKCKDRLDELAVVFQEAKRDLSREEYRTDRMNETYGIALLEMQEKERQRISRDLHDYTVQNLTALVHKTELCSKMVDIDPVRSKLELSMMSKTLREIIDDTRYMIYNLRPMSFDDIGLEIAIERALDKLEMSGQKKIKFSVEGEAYELKPIIGITLLRIIQEGCSNAVRHAKSSYIKVMLTYHADHISVLIEDDGKGFDMQLSPNKNEDYSGFGLRMMKERVYLLSGKLEITSREDCGTKILVRIPVTGEEE